MKQEVQFKFETKDKQKITLNGEDAYAIWQFLNGFYGSRLNTITVPTITWPSYPQWPNGTWITCSTGTSGTIEIK